MPRDAQDDSEAFICEVSWHYFINEMTQAEIAEMLGVTRLRVNQAIQRAKALGVVKVQIDSPFLPRVELQRQVEQALGIPRALVAPADRLDYDYHASVGAALATHLSERLRSQNWKSIGVSWGVTLESAIRKLPRQSFPGLEVVSILGGTSRGVSINSFGIASGFADALGAKYSLLASPIYISEGLDRDLFLSQEVLREHFDKFPTLDAVILTCSNVSPKSFLISYGLPSHVTPETLIAAGAVGDVLGQFLDSEGRSVSEEIDSRTIGMPLAMVETIPEKILAAAGPHKVDVIRAAARRGLIDTLVTDDVTAELLIRQETP